MLGHLLSADRFRKHLGLVLAEIHLIWFLAVVATLCRRPHAEISFLPDGSSSATLFAGRPFHFEYESVIVKLLMLADIPAALVVGLLEYCSASLLRSWASDYARSYIDAGLLLFAGTMQWTVIGCFISSRIGAGQKLLKRAS
jgi:hypothetical protein